MKLINTVFHLRTLSITVSLVALLAASAAALAADGPDPLLPTDDLLPNPTGPNEDVSRSIPLPEPSIGSPGLNDGTKQVNRLEDEDHIYLPSPVTSDIPYNPPLNYAPAMPMVNSEYYSSGAMERPNLGIHLGPSIRNYPTTLVDSAKLGGVAALSYRVLSLSRVLFFQLYADFQYYRTPGIGQWINVQDLTYHLGATMELALGRRFQLYGGLYRRNNKITADYDPKKPTPDRNQLAFVDEKPSIFLGGGAQYDFYVIPHGSIGVRFFIERDITYLALTFLMEPAPRKKINLNFDDTNRYF